ncbi:MAG TPA: transglycosylase family protein [Acidimicrobiia bacterium]|nr:transglycosylase family protein [Acidimicrobiia bacterium]
MSRWTHRHVLRARRRPSSAHVADLVQPSPARAEPHDETSWLPLPEPEGLPSVEELLTPDVADTTEARAVPPSLPSPARAEPHDETAWLPLPEIEDLPEITDLLSPDTNLDVPAARELPPAQPSPARAEPHDETSWLPLPEIEDLPDITEFVDPEPATTPPPDVRRHRRGLTGLGPRRMLAVALATVIVAGGAYLIPRVFNQGDHVQIRVDGRLISAQSGQSTVGALLKEQKVTLGADDRVEPSRASSLSDGMTVRVLRAFPVTVDLDGATRVVYTAYSVPRDFVASLKLPANVAPRNPPTKLQSGASIQLRTRRKGTLALDGQGVNYDLPVLTVRELLANYKVVLGPQDTTDPPVDSVIPVDNPFVTVVRVATNIQVVSAPYAVPDQTLPDPNLDVGSTRDQPGSPGVMRTAYAVTSNNGSESGRIPVSQVPTVVAQPTIHYFGTKADPRWDNIARCETGGNWAMQGPQFSGGVGFYNGTWNSFGGQQFAPNAGMATREQQIIVAERVRKRYGFTAWGCGKKLGYP